MTEYRTILVDDEVHCLETLQWQLENYCPQVKVLASFRSSTDALDFLRNHEVDLVFLDIEMPMMNGFELLKSLDTLAFGLVFTTAYDEFAQEAAGEFEIPYLLKPIDNKELIEAVEHATADTSSFASRIREFFKRIDQG